MSNNKNAEFSSFMSRHLVALTSEKENLHSCCSRTYWFSQSRAGQITSDGLSGQRMLVLLF